MGAYVSVPICESQYHITINCDLNFTDSTNETLQSIGGIVKGGVEPDSDIAGVGVLGVFVAVTVFALVVSMIDVLRQLHKTIKWKRLSLEERALRLPKKRTLTDVLEALVQACSDQQIFTGAAYALTLRYWRGCTISAYHYNIVANILLLTCATHLMSVTIIRNYWKHPLLAIARVFCVTGVFVLTGVLMSNQNADSSTPFPTAVPSDDTLRNGSLMYLSAACFQNENSHLTDIFRDSTSSAHHLFEDTLGQNKPNNYIQGWRWYLVSLLFYGAAIIAEFIRYCRRGQKRPGWRRSLANTLRPLLHTGTHRRIFIKWVFLLYLAGGIGISCATVYYSTTYIYALRSYVNRSGWLAVEDNNGQNPENDATSFGQLVPIFLSALILFTFLQTFSEKWTDHKNRKHRDEEAAPQGGSIPFLDPSSYDVMDLATGKLQPITVYANNIPTPGSADIESAQPWPHNRSSRKPSIISSDHSSSGRISHRDAEAPVLGDEITSSAFALRINPNTPAAVDGRQSTNAQPDGTSNNMRDSGYNHEAGPKPTLHAIPAGTESHTQKAAIPVSSLSEMQGKQPRKAGRDAKK